MEELEPEEEEEEDEEEVAETNQLMNGGEIEVSSLYNLNILHYLLKMLRERKIEVKSEWEIWSWEKKKLQVKREEVRKKAK